MTSTFSGLPSSQDEQELSGLIKLMRSLNCRSYLEIGARDGDGFHAIVSAMPPGSRAVAVDLPGGPWGRNSQEALRRAVADLRRKGYMVAACFGNSRDPSVIAEVAGGYDAIMIDGDHRYSGVLADWINYGHMAKKMVAFHDIAGHGVVQKTSKLPVEVPKLWDEIKGGYDHREFITPGVKMGIGVLLK